MRAGYRPAVESNAVAGAIQLDGKCRLRPLLPVRPSKRLSDFRDQANHASCSGLATDVEPAGPQAGDQMLR